MAEKDLINLGTAPDSGTGDSARRGGQKINNLFADIYSQLGDNPIGNDPNAPFYGYRRPFRDFEYKVGELHPAGRFAVVTFNNAGAGIVPDATFGFGVDGAGAFTFSALEPDVPEIYRDSEWYFLSRGEAVTADLRSVTVGGEVNFVLPLARAGDQCIIKDSFSSWDLKTLNIWTTPYEFKVEKQLTEWKTNTPESTRPYPDSDAIAVTDFSGIKYYPVYKRPVLPGTLTTPFPKLDQRFTTASGTKSLVRFENAKDAELVFTYQGPDIGWVVAQRQVTGVQLVVNAEQDIFKESEWLLWTEPSITVSDGTGTAEIELETGMYVLPIAPTDRYRDIDNATSIPFFSVFRRMTQRDDDSEVLSQLNSFFDKAVNKLLPYTLTDAQEKRAKVVYGRDSDGAFTDTPGLSADDDGKPIIANGFADTSPFDLYKEVNLSSISDPAGNILLISQEPFTGYAQIIIPGAQAGV